MINLQNRFRVALPVEDTWRLLTDLPKVARCLPGASLDEVVDGEHRGGLATRIGPISAKYHGVATFRERDDVGHRAVIEARGREDKGSGSASALITAVLEPDGDGTVVDVATELTVSGRAAQFGRSLLAEVSNTMVDEFVRRLETMISESGGSPSGATASDASDRPHVAQPAGSADSGQGDSLDVMRVIIRPMLAKAVVPLAAAAVSFAAGLLVGRSRRPRRRRLFR